MNRGNGNKNGWALILLLLAGVVLGGFIGQLTESIPVLSWLNYGESFGLSSPLILNLGVVAITFALTIKITIASIIGILIAIIIYKNI